MDTGSEIPVGSLRAGVGTARTSFLRALHRFSNWGVELGSQQSRSAGYRNRCKLLPILFFSLEHWGRSPTGADPFFRASLRPPIGLNIRRVQHRVRYTPRAQLHLDAARAAGTPAPICQQSKSGHPTDDSSARRAELDEGRARVFRDPRAVPQLAPPPHSASVAPANRLDGPSRFRKSRDSDGRHVPTDTGDRQCKRACPVRVLAKKVGRTTAAPLRRPT